MPLPDEGGRWLLGVDGGGTKTHFLLLHCDGGDRASRVGPGSYHIDIGVDGVGAVLRDGIDALCGAAGIAPADIAYAFFGLPAFGESPAKDGRLADLPRTLLGHDRYRVDNDMVCAWAGSLAGADGINIVAGTGSIAYGERGSRTARCGGWGELFGDEGSAYWTAIRGLNLFTRMSDGRLPRGPLHTLFRDRLDLASDMDVLSRYLEDDSSRRTIAGLAPLVSEAAAAGDDAANGVLMEAAEALADHAAALATPLGYQPDDKIIVSGSGGMFSMGDGFFRHFCDALRAADSRLTGQRPLHSPQEGAVLAAARYGGIALGHDILN